MELAFGTKALRELCEQEDAAAGKFGDKVALELRARVADLRAADSVADLVAGTPRVIGGQDPRLIISILGALEMVIRPNHIRMPLGTDGELDWQHVRRIRLDKLT